MVDKRVQRVQGIRRSNAAQPIPGKRKYDAPWFEDQEWAELTAGPDYDIYYEEED